jgi:hypothetical protein
MKRVKVLSAEAFNENFDAALNKAKHDGFIFILHNSHYYALVSINEETLTTSPEIQACVDAATQLCESGERIICHTQEEVADYFSDTSC